MRNVIATVLQVTAAGLILAGLFAVSAFLAAGAVVAVAGYLLAPERQR